MESFVLKAWIPFTESANRVHVSQPWRRMEVTRDLHSFNLLAKLMVLHHQILFSLATAAIAEAILMQTSTEQVPSLHRVAPRYLKLVTSSKFWSFMLISALMQAATHCGSRKETSTSEWRDGAIHESTNNSVKS